MKFLVFILMTCSLFSCGDRSYTFLVDPIINSYSQEMSNKRGYFLTGTGGSMPNHDIHSIFMSFTAVEQSDMSIVVARRLYIELVEGLIKKLNQDKKIRPYLHDYPATYKNCEILLSFVDQCGHRLDENQISLVFQVNDEIYYSKYNHPKKKLEDVLKEPYEEALKIVQEEHCSSAKNL